uniref:Cytochrome b6-f complex subunit 7 n=1 Tax=Acrochaetium secundatum TaxID=209631 RepID=A0A4D6BLS3_9FLOR|nr:cytochrome b6-f complex subunit VII [Acrochaetium secundatum]QBX88437.1 cytochrome b6-f complex subunit VII [Acrochaetium secundatum]
MGKEIIDAAIMSSTMVLIGLTLGFVLLKVQGE